MLKQVISNAHVASSAIDGRSMVQNLSVAPRFSTITLATGVALRCITWNRAMPRANP